MYTRGPTADGRLHLGLSRRFVVADLLKRRLKARGLDVNHIVNITDLDDRIIHGSEMKGLTPEAFTARYIDSFLTDMDRLGVERPTRRPRTTDHVPEMIELTRTLISRGVAL